MKLKITLLILALVCLCSAQEPKAAYPQRAVDFTFNLPNPMTTPCNGLGTNSPCVWTAGTTTNFPDTGAGLQYVLQYYNPGDVIILTAGKTYTATGTKNCAQGNQFSPAAHFVFWGKSNPTDKWTYVMSSAWQSLPQNTRVNENTNPALLATLSTNDTQSVVCPAAGANDIRFVGVQITSNSTVGTSATGPWATGMTTLLAYSPPAGGTGRREVSITPNGGSAVVLDQAFQIDTNYPRFDYWLQSGGNCNTQPINYSTSLPADGTQYTFCFKGQNTHWHSGGTPVVTVGGEAIFDQSIDVINGTPNVTNDTTMSMTMQANLSLPTGFVPFGNHYVHVTTPLPATTGECATTACTEEAYTYDPLVMVGTSSLNIPALSAVCQANTGPGTANPCNNTFPNTGTTSFRLIGNTTGFGITHFASGCPVAVTNTACSVAAISGNIFKSWTSITCTGQECDIAGATPETYADYTYSPMAVVTGLDAPVVIGADEVDTMTKGAWMLAPGSNGCHVSYVFPNHGLPGQTIDVTVVQSEPYTGAGKCMQWTTSNLNDTTGIVDFNHGPGATTIGAAWTYPTGGGVTINHVIANDSAYCSNYATGYCAHVNLTIDSAAEEGSHGLILDRSELNGDLGDLKYCTVTYNSTTRELQQTHDSRCWTPTNGTFCGNVIATPGNNGAFYTCHAQIVDIAIRAEGGDFGMIDSTIRDIYPDNEQESHGLYYAANPGPITLANSEFKNIATEEIFSGGTSGITGQSLQNPRDIIYGDSAGLTGFVPHGNSGEALAGNYLYRDLVATPLCNAIFNNGQPYTAYSMKNACKNIIEFKNGQRALGDGLWLENQINAAQAFAFDLTPRVSGDVQSTGGIRTIGADQGQGANLVSDITYTNTMTASTPDWFDFIAQDYGVSPMFYCSQSSGCKSGAAMINGTGWPGFSSRINIKDNLWLAIDPASFYNRAGAITNNYGFLFTVNSQNMLFSHNTVTMDQLYANPSGISHDSWMQWGNSISGCKDPSTNPGTVSSTNAWVVDSHLLGYSAANSCQVSSDYGTKILFYYANNSPTECNVGAGDAYEVRHSGNVYYTGNTNVYNSCDTNVSPNFYHYPTKNSTSAYTYTGPALVSRGGNYELATTTGQDWRNYTHDGYQAGVDMTTLNANLASIPSGTGGPYITTTPKEIPLATYGTLYSTQLYAVLGAVGQYTWNLTGTMCSGLSMSSTGLITGTPTQVQTCNFSVTATDVNDIVSTSMAESITVQPQTGTQLSIQTASPLPSADASGDYDYQFQANGGTAPYNWSETGTLPAGMTFTSGGLLTATNITAAPGVYTFSVTVTDSASHTAGPQTFQITILAALEFNTTSVSSAEVGTQYTANLQCTGGQTPYTWAVTSGPMVLCTSGNYEGLCLDQNQGTISGKPTTAGTITSTYACTDNAYDPSTASGSVSVNVSGVIGISTQTLPDGNVGAQYSQTIFASGGVGPYSWSATGLPCDNIALGSSTTTSVPISGLPNTGEVCSFTVTVTDALNASASAQLSINVHGTVNPLVITSPNNISNGTVGNQYSYPLQATGGSGVYTWSILSGGLPNGLSMNAQGVISGIPEPKTTPYHVSIQVQVADNIGTTPAKKNIFFTINNTAGEFISSGTLITSGSRSQ